jgi:hypothetical protein
MGEIGAKMSLGDLDIDDRIIIRICVKIEINHRINTIKIRHSRAALKGRNLLKVRLPRGNFRH